MVVILFKISFEDDSFLPWSAFLIHYLIGYENCIQNLFPLNKSALSRMDSFV